MLYYTKFVSSRQHDDKGKGPTVDVGPFVPGSEARDHWHGHGVCCALQTPKGTNLMITD